MSARMFNGSNLPHELFLTQRQITKLRNNIENNLQTDIKLGKAQIFKIIQSGGFLGKPFCPLLKTGLPLLKSWFIRSQSNFFSNSCRISKKIYGSGTTTLVISNEEMNEIMKIVKALENAGILLK